MKPSESVKRHAQEIRSIVERNNARNPRVFGSTAFGSDTDTSDLDLLVDPIAGKTTLFNLMRIKREVEAVLGIKADVLTPMSLRDSFRNDVLRTAKPL